MRRTPLRRNNRAGNLGNTITVDGQASATVKSGTGNDDFIDKSTGSLTLTGGGGSDVFEFLAGAHATITDFQAGQDSIVLHGLTASQVQVTASQGNTFLALGNNSQVELAGVSLTTSQLHIDLRVRRANTRPFVRAARRLTEDRAGRCPGA